MRILIVSTLLLALCACTALPGTSPATSVTLTPETAAQIKPGMTRQEVERLLGPPEPQWTVSFSRQNETALDWLMLDHGEPFHFVVLVDNTSGKVKRMLVTPFRVIPSPN